MAKKASKIFAKLGNAKTRTLVIFLGVIVSAGIIITLLQLGGDSVGSGQGSSTVGVPSSVKAVPGNAVPERYRELQQEENLRRANQAAENENSSIPTIIGALTPSELDADAFNSAEGDSEDNDMFGDISRGGFEGGGTFNSSDDEAQDEEALRQQRLKEQRDRLARLKAERERQRELERLQRLAEQERQAYQQSVQQAAQAMQQHAQTVFSGWATITPQTYVQGMLAFEESEPATRPAAMNAANDKNPDGTANNNPNSAAAIRANRKKRVIIKAGTVMFGVLDTAINTDEKGPVMASIVHGKYKGTKLLGNIEHNGFAEKAIIRFDRVSIPKRLESLGAEIVAIDPDTARTALASDVDRHYLLRYGSLFASSFMEGFGEAISQQGTTTTAADGSTQQTKPKLTGKDQIYSALGNVGSQWATQAAPLFNTPYTVTVDQGVGMGLLFLNDLDVTPKEE